jgi:hypothetical protein
LNDAQFSKRVWPEPNSGCHLWAGSTSDWGYGQVRVKGKRVMAHRYAYEKKRGPIPPGLDLDHLCRVRCCVNPDHLEPVTRRENTLRGVGQAAVHARKTHCPYGHALAAARPAGKQKRHRACLPCHAAHERRRRARRRAHAIEAAAAQKARTA